RRGVASRSIPRRPSARINPVSAVRPCQGALTGDGGGVTVLFARPPSTTATTRCRVSGCRWRMLGAYPPPRRCGPQSTSLPSSCAPQRNGNPDLHLLAELATVRQALQELTHPEAASTEATLSAPLWRPP